ncbi:ATP-binding protein [Paenibacillus sp. GD4]|uniref:ATP-binding protein n=1 Tax=Paenibacillus sp. GD4 TaxID=3068890 RepID=UPI002796CCE9|nr:sensor histidine kinase [Paenibacillus sp. GD4]MDQ1913908.1 ATP-binding protein [Paenibacillus sp. GD4]
MDELEPLLLNVLFIIIFLLFIPMFMHINRFNGLANLHKRKWVQLISAGIASISCIMFPITIVEGYIYDLRLIAVVLGGLYGGVAGSIFLVAATLTFRWFWLGGSGASASIIVCTILLLVIILLTKHYVNASRRHKLILGNAVSMFAAVLALTVSIVIFQVAFNLFFVISYLLLTVFTTAIVVYIYEVFHENMLIGERVIKAEKMEMVSQLSSSISHEVRNPLAVVRGFLQMMEQTEIPVEKRNQFLKICIGEIDRANDIIQNYLTFSKPAVQNVGNMDIKDQLQKAIHIISPLANMNCVEIESRLESYLIKGEPQLLQQCLLNLTKNCIEAMPDGGSLYIETKLQNGELVIVIADTGKGMTTEQLSRIGEPYFTTKGREGTGLGMMTAMRIIEMMRGKLTVSSHMKKGSTFTIRFPLEASGEQAS